ncbi:hypothetical protein DEU56DRAFT_745549 [Suillus clintonianus]|uniref:uncharacterized protein n=1 Tax=Suillus clintonianus TaxID=1904413 RepID=UPI001B87005F|nr:uncharacterized protein DEU56DRAFT_745549 [Suillus clintonianus]KAG2123257.1 hypothetical protein DEU56DRAFT_745549 [Suillus clintonianus]
MRLTTSKDPVVIGEAPLACSMHSCGRRAFADGRIDQKGLPRLPRLHLPPSTPSSRRRAQVVVEITRPPPRPASRAVRKPSVTRTSNLIPPITSVKGGTSGSEYDNSADNDDDEDEESQVSEIDSRPVKRLRR